MDGMSWFADMEEPAEPQTSRVKITAVSFCEERCCHGMHRRYQTDDKSTEKQYACFSHILIM